MTIKSSLRAAAASVAVAAAVATLAIEAIFTGLFVVCLLYLGYLVFLGPGSAVAAVAAVAVLHLAEDRPGWTGTLAAAALGELVWFAGVFWLG